MGQKGGRKRVAKGKAVEKVAKGRGYLNGDPDRDRGQKIEKESKDGDILGYTPTLEDIRLR